MRHLYVSYVLAVTLLSAQTGGRLDAQKKRGFSLVQAALDPLSLSSPDRFDKAAGELSVVWEQERPPDGEVAENLAMAFLNGEKRRYDPTLPDKAAELMGKAVELGANASFLVNHAHDKLGVIQGGIKTNYCSGKLSIRQGNMTYVSQFGDRATEHSFEIDPSFLKKALISRNMLRLEFLGKDGKEKGYHIFARTQLEGDARTILNFVQKVFSNSKQ